MCGFVHMNMREEVRERLQITHSRFRRLPLTLHNPSKTIIPISMAIQNFIHVLRKIKNKKLREKIDWGIKALPLSIFSLQLAKICNMSFL
jgi:hypothetical protein